MAEVMPYVAIAVGALSIVLMIALLTSFTLRSQFPNWLQGIKSLPVPRNLGERSGWKNGWSRVKPEPKRFMAYMPCMIRYCERGILVQDLWFYMSSRGLCTKHQTMFIPWTAMSDPREPWRDRWYATAGQRSIVEFDVAGQEFSMLLDPRMVQAYAPSSLLGEFQEQEDYSVQS